MKLQNIYEMYGFMIYCKLVLCLLSKYIPKLVSAAK